MLYLKREAVGAPEPDVTWRRNGAVLQSRNNQTSFVCEDASEDDAGNYEWKASHTAGSDRYHVAVTIEGKPQ